MWIHIGIFLAFGILFFLSRGFFSKSGSYLAGHLPDFLTISKKQMCLALVLLFAANGVGLFVTISRAAETDTAKAGYLIRPEKGEGNVQEELVVTDGENKESIAVDVMEQPYTEEELSVMLDTALQSLDERILGENESFERIEYPMELVTVMEELPVVIEWNTSQPIYLDWEGNIGEDIPEEGASVELTGEMTLEESIWTAEADLAQTKYSRTYQRSVTVFPEKKSGSEAFVRDVNRALKKLQKGDAIYQYLPESLNGKTLFWSRAADRTGLWIVAFAGIVGLLLILSEKSRQNQKEKEFKRQMLLDYPGIIQKLILLMRAGVSSRRAIRKIALDYKRETERGKDRRKAYDEILRTYYEMEQGMSEEEAYQRLGARCEIAEYRTLSTLLIQNLKRGSGQFFPMMEQERIRALAERKKSALILGEEAGTKLLMPMMVMLLLVLMILLVPSFFSIY